MSASRSVEIRGKTWEIDNIVWGSAEPDVGIMSDYPEYYDLVDSDGNVWDWEKELMTPEEEKAVDNVLSTIFREYDCD